MENRTTKGLSSFFWILLSTDCYVCYKGHGIDTKVHGLKIKSDKDGDVGVNRDLFIKSNLVRFPKLESFDQEVLYRRALLLGRFLLFFLSTTTLYTMSTCQSAIKADYLQRFSDVKIASPSSGFRTYLIEGSCLKH